MSVGVTEGFGVPVGSGVPGSFGVAVGITSPVRTGVPVRLGTGVPTRTGVTEGTGVAVGLREGRSAGVAVLVGAGVAVLVGSGVAVLVGAGVSVLVGAGVSVLVGAGVAVLVGAGVAVLVGTGISVTGSSPVGKAVADGVSVATGLCVGSISFVGFPATGLLTQPAGTIIPSKSSITNAAAFLFLFSLFPGKTLPPFFHSAHPYSQKRLQFTVKTVYADILTHLPPKCKKNYPKGNKFLTHFFLLVLQDKILPQYLPGCQTIQVSLPRYPQNSSSSRCMHPDTPKDPLPLTGYIPGNGR